MTDCPDLPEWAPDPPMVFAGDRDDWINEAFDWIERQWHDWNADDLHAAMPEGRSHWPGLAIKMAAGREMIRLSGGSRRSTRKSRKGSLIPYWYTAKPTHTPKETPHD